MPFGRKPDAAGRLVDFDAVYQDLIAPAVAAANLEPLRADEELTGGIIHKPMFERLLLCEYAVADLTTANANVFYELGVRHAARAWSTVLIFASGGSQLPFDVAPLRAMPYKVTAAGVPDDLLAARDSLAARLNEARQATADSPLYQLVEGFPDIQHLKTDVFRERVRYSQQLKADLASARKKGVDAVRAVQAGLGAVADTESGVVIDLFLSYRAVSAWDDMIALVAQMALPLTATTMVREQLGLALNRAGRGDEAERILTTLIDDRGPSSETYGILGRVYKDRWNAAVKDGEPLLARALLEKAVAAYLKGFETDWRDAYPGVNAVTLMEIKDPPDERRHALLPVVRYAVERRIVGGKADYWDHATMLEMSVLGKDEAQATSSLGDALALSRERWELATTLRNLRLIREARERRNEHPAWATELETTLEARSKRAF
jgi:hypothetical protein